MEKVELLHFFMKINPKIFKKTIDVEVAPNHMIISSSLKSQNNFDSIVTYMSRKEKE